MTLLYQIGKPHRQGTRFPTYDTEALWRGPEVPGQRVGEDGWKMRAVARLPNHEKIRPSTDEG
jgi:hypothetical protein